MCATSSTPRATWAIRTTLWCAADWLLHDIVITNIVWCMAYKREVEGSAAQEKEEEEEVVQVTGTARRRLCK